MMKKWFLTLLIPSIVNAMPSQGFYMGVGGGYNSIHLNEDITGFATSKVYSGATQVAYGTAGGPATGIVSTESTFAPAAQAGYYGHFNKSQWLGGAKFFYQYLGTTLSNSPVDLPQNGEFTTISGSDTFIGNAVIGSAQTTINDQLGFMATLGRSFEKSFIYLGIGPSLMNITTELLDGTGYADINGVHTDITGSALNFSTSQWVWGGVAQLGITYFFDPSWFIDVNYSYAFTGNFTSEDNAEFTSTTHSGTSTFTTTGDLTVETTQKVMTQGVSLLINKRF